MWKCGKRHVCCEKYWNGFYWYHPQLFVNGNMKNVEPSEPDCLVETKLKETALHCTLSKLFLSTLSSHIFYVRLKTIPTFLHVHWKSYWSLHMFLLSILALENPFWHDSHVLTVATWWGGGCAKMLFIQSSSTANVSLSVWAPRIKWDIFQSYRLCRMKFPLGAFIPSLHLRQKMLSGETKGGILY